MRVFGRGPYSTLSAMSSESKKNKIKLTCEDSMPIAKFDHVSLHYREDGDPNGEPLVFSNSLGTDLRLWDSVIPLLPKGLRIVRYDKRGHGSSSVHDAPYSMGSLVRDAELLLDFLKIRDCVFAGLSIGGMIAQGLAVKRHDLVRAMVLSNTAVKIGTVGMWQDRISMVRAGGIEALADAVMERWFSQSFLKSGRHAFWRNMLVEQSAQGYIGCCAAISGTDFLAATSGLRLPVLGIAGSEDGSTPPDMVRETSDLVPGSQFALIRDAGHLPCVEKPEEYAKVLSGFLREVGHVET